MKQRRFNFAIFFALFIIVPAAARAQRDPNRPPEQVPPPGIEVVVADRTELQNGLVALDKLIAQLAKHKDPSVTSLLPDVEVFAAAVRTALNHNEFFAAADVGKAKELLRAGTERARQLLDNRPAWTKQPGTVVRGYVSRIDGSLQPYGLVVPESYRPGGNDKFRLDVWLHGRNEKLSEVNFLDERMKKPGEFTPPATIVLHPYGRYCNAFKFAGEVDVWEAIEAVKKQYRIDDDRIAIRGFSMGGAGCWHLAVHYANQWVCAAPGAGFAESIEYLKMSPNEFAELPSWQQKLFHLYDANDWALNLYHCPTIAYSGELDKQKQAADIMEQALAAEGIKLRHVIGPDTEHKYHPDAKRTISEAVDSIAEVGRDRYPAAINFVTYTLKYNRIGWLEVESLGEHWKESRVSAEITGEGAIFATTENVTDLKFEFPPGWSPFDVTANVPLTIDDQELEGPRTLSDRSFTCQVHLDDEGKWQIGARQVPYLRKLHNLQGPIDDAFMDSFIIVRPTGKSSREKAAKWVDAEMNRAIRQWRTQFRGQPRVKDDTQITDEDIASANLILWGDVESNDVIKRIAEHLPIGWKGDNVTLGDQNFSAEDHVPVYIYPNPLNQQRYMVLNSGFTYREADFHGSNARQIPRLPDWAIIDIRTPADANQPGKIVAAGFFAEGWGLPSGEEKAEEPKTAAAQ
jgi:dienelactone hydrolase